MSWLGRTFGNKEMTGNFFHGSSDHPEYNSVFEQILLINLLNNLVCMEENCMEEIANGDKHALCTL